MPPAKPRRITPPGASVEMIKKGLDYVLEMRGSPKVPKEGEWGYVPGLSIPTIEDRRDFCLENFMHSDPAVVEMASHTLNRLLSSVIELKKLT